MSCSTDQTRPAVRRHFTNGHGRRAGQGGRAWVSAMQSWQGSGFEGLIEGWGGYRSHTHSLWHTSNTSSPLQSTLTPLHTLKYKIHYQSIQSPPTTNVKSWVSYFFFDCRRGWSRAQATLTFFPYLSFPSLNTSNYSLSCSKCSNISLATSDSAIAIAFGLISTLISLLGVFIGYLTLRAMTLEASMRPPLTSLSNAELSLQ
jgi:hypothetical protein